MLTQNDVGNEQPVRMIWDAENNYHEDNDQLVKRN